MSKIADEEFNALSNAKSADEWNKVCDGIKASRMGMASITINYTQSEIAALITADVRAKGFEPRNVNFDVTESEPHTLSATCRAELRQKSPDSSGNFKDY